MRGVRTGRGSEPLKCVTNPFIQYKLSIVQATLAHPYDGRNKHSVCTSLERIYKVRTAAVTTTKRIVALASSP